VSLKDIGFLTRFIPHLTTARRSWCKKSANALIIQRQSGWMLLAPPFKLIHVQPDDVWSQNLHGGINKPACNW
jgi:hypothetical protein